MLTAYVRKHGFRVLPIDLNIQFYLNRPREFDRVWDLEQSQCFWEMGATVTAMMRALWESVDAFVELVIATKTRVVGFTIYNTSMRTSLELARMLREARSQHSHHPRGPTRQSAPSRAIDHQESVG